MRVHVFRPQADAERSARALKERGFEPVVTPLFIVVSLPEPVPEGPFDALVLTSGNALLPLADAPAGLRDLPVFTVGARTAARAREAGFGDARSADGDRNDMIALITGNMPSGAKLLMVSGRDRAEDVAPRLEQAGFSVTIWTAYAAEAIDALPDELASSLRREGEAAALHYSPRGAQTFLDLTRKAGLEEQALALTHVTLSAAVAAPLIEAGADTVLVAEHPEEPALVAALSQVTARPDAAAIARDPALRREPPTIDGTAVEGAAAPGAGPDDETASPDTLAETRDREPTATAAVAPLPTQPSMLPRLLLAGVLGGVVGAGIVMVALGRDAQPAVGIDQIADLRSRIETLQKSTAALPDREAFDALDQKVAGAAEAARAASSRISELAAAKPAAPDPAVIAGVTEEAKRARNEAAAAQSAAAALSNRLASLESSAQANAGPSRQAQAAARLSLAERVQAALDSGRPYAADLAALAAGGLAEDRLAPLRPLAESGGPTRDALLAQLRSQPSPAARDTAPVAQGWQDRLAGLASRIVTIRPATEGNASAATGLRGRIEAALARGDFAAAAQAWEELPEQARRDSAAFGAALQQRAAAGAAAARIAQDAVTAMGTPG